jgi:protein TonB
MSPHSEQILRCVLLHNIALMLPRLTLALALSLALHGSLFLPDAFKRPSAAPPRPVLQALLRLPPREEIPPADPLLKNTLEAEKGHKEVASTVRQPTLDKKPKPARTITAKQAVKVAQKKLSQHLYYPPEAVKRGIEGEVRLLLTLTADGHIADINIAATSGHPMLDNAALKAAYAMGALSGTEARELILPVIFRLQ